MRRKRNNKKRIVPILAFMLFMLLAGRVQGAGAKSCIAEGEATIRASDDGGHMESESELGSLTADGLRWYGKADAALFPCGDLSGANLMAGEIDQAGLLACFSRDDTAVKVVVSGSQLHELLWHSVSHFRLNDKEQIDWENSGFGGYLHTAGILATLDYAALPDTPVYQLRTEDRREIPADDTVAYTLVTTRGIAEGEYGYITLTEQSYQELGRVTEIMEEYLGNLGRVSEPAAGRVKVIGTKEYTIVRKWPWQFFLLAVVLFGGGGYLKERLKRSGTR